MHEMYIARSIIRNLQDIAEREGFGKIIEVRIKVGVLSGVEPYLLEKALSYVKKGTPFEDVNLLIEVDGLNISCGCCNYRGDVKEYMHSCPECGSSEISFEGGDGLTIESVRGVLKQVI